MLHTAKALFTLAAIALMATTVPAKAQQAFAPFHDNDSYYIAPQQPSQTVHDYDQNYVYIYPARPAQPLHHAPTYHYPTAGYGHAAPYMQHYLGNNPHNAYHANPNPTQLYNRNTNQETTWHELSIMHSY